MYHKLTITYNDLPRPYLIKQKRPDLNKVCLIERVPGKYPGAQVSFVETLKEHVNPFLKGQPDHDIRKPINVKIYADGAKMSRTTHFLLLSFALLQTGSNVMSPKGNRTIAVVNRPEKYDTLNSSL